jgi:hypothetical protein
MRHALLGLSTSVLLTFAASPALAGSRHHVRHYARDYDRALAAPYAGNERPFVPNESYGNRYNSGTVESGGPIYRQGYYLGTDPDPRIRQELIRDAFHFLDPN